MVLPSQTARPSVPRRRSLPRRRPRRTGRHWPWLLAALIVVLVIIYAWQPSSEGPQSDPASSLPVSENLVAEADREGASGIGLSSSGADQGHNTHSEAIDQHGTQDRSVGQNSNPDRADTELPAVDPVTADNDNPPDRVTSAGTGGTVETEQFAATATSGSDSRTDADLATDGPAPQGGDAPPVELSARSEINAAMASAQRLIKQGKFRDARQELSRLLDKHGAYLSASQATTIGTALNKLNGRLFVSSAVAGDSLVEDYKVPRGDKFIDIGRRCKVPYELIMRINGIKDAARLQAGSTIKILRGPFHAIITKSAFRMDVYTNAQNGEAIFLASFPVGLGEDDSTPLGNWMVGRGKKINPDWKNPRRPYEYFSPDDPKNPIGEHWIPLRGIDDKTRELKRYGLHGTIEPESVGRQASMGCVRLLPKDAELVFQMLASDHSRVTIRP